MGVHGSIPSGRWRATPRRWDAGGVTLAALAAVSLGYVGWVLLVGHGQEANPTRHLVSLLAYLLVGGASVVLPWRVSRLAGLPASARQGWHLLSIALGLNWLGNLLYALLDDVLAPLPLPMIANGVFTAFYILAFLALPRFARTPRIGTDRLKLFLDAAMVVVPGGMILWRLMTEPIASSFAHDPWGATFSLSLPLCDLVILAGLATILVQPRHALAERPLRILALGMLLYVIGDVVFARLALAGAYWSGALPNALWIVAVWLFALAADVQRREVARRQRTGELQDTASHPADSTGTGFSPLPAIAVAVGYGLLLLEAAEHRDLSWTVTVAGVAMLTVCLIARQVIALRENARLLAERLRRHGDARFSSLVRHSRDVVTIVGADGAIGYASPSVERLLGHEPAALNGASALTLVWSADVPAARTFLADAVASPGATTVTDLRLVHVDGSIRDCELIAINLLDDASVHGVVLTCRDMTEHRAFERELTELAVNDRLTGLPNRTLLLDRVSRAIARAHRRQTCVATLFVDLDNFKLINDSLGHQMGDELLIVVAERLRASLRAEDTLARMGGDELAILIEDVADEAEVIAVAERILDALSTPFQIGRQSLFTTASIGIALSGQTVDQPSSLLRNADLALYQAKAQGKARWAVFDPGLNDVAHERLELETGLRGVVEQGSSEHGSLWVAYQPIVDLETGAIREVEALARWQHPTLGLIAPGRFIPVAEETGLIVQIGGRVLSEACQQVARWQAELGSSEPLVVGVNLSGRQLQDPGLVETVARVLAETGLEGASLKLELTESVVMESAETTIQTLGRLKALGVRLAIDDFGTGYSSLAYLKRFPVDALKIDRSFVAGLGRDPQDTAIVESVITLARGLGLTVTGEGVETAEQAACLKRLGGDLAQGYYYAAPLAPERLAPLLADSFMLDVSDRIVAFPGREALSPHPTTVQIRRSSSPRA